MNVDVVVFEPDDLAPVLAGLTPKGWVNLQPEVDVDAEPASQPSGLFGLFGSRGPAVPFCTWHPGERSVGIQHSTGGRLKERVDVPAGWRVVQDHPKRGFVAQVPADVTDAEALAWLVHTAGPLSGLPLLGRWVAEVHS
jgi:hypothetical protein